MHAVHKQTSYLQIQIFVAKWCWGGLEMGMGIGPSALSDPTRFVWGDVVLGGNGYIVVSFQVAFLCPLGALIEPPGSGLLTFLSTWF